MTGYSLLLERYDKAYTQVSYGNTEGIYKNRKKFHRVILEEFIYKKSFIW